MSKLTAKIQIVDSAGNPAMVDAEVVPFHVESEAFNLYSLNVSEEHKLSGRQIKVKLVLSQVFFSGFHDNGLPRINVSFSPVVSVE
jgi:hypothetical protein